METQTTTNIPKGDLSRCDVCGKVNKRWFELFGVKRVVSIICDCEQKKLDDEKRQEELVTRKLKIKELRTMSLLGERYQNSSFETTTTGFNQSFDNAFNRCKKYCDGYEENVQNGYGIYLFGDKGVGKTHLTACIVNDLLAKCVPVLFTNLFEISKSIKSTFSKESTDTEQQLIRKFSNIPVLVFDDLGTENFVKNSSDTWLQSVLFDLINTRYNRQKATIFSSNYNLNELISKRGIFEKTVDRICEMTSGAVMKITGKSLRNNLKKNINF